MPYSLGYLPATTSRWRQDRGAVDTPGVPAFRYHPDPIATESAVPSDAACSVCGGARGFVYDGPIYGRQSGALCLVCIASGEASRALSGPDFAAEFTDVGFGVPDGVPSSALNEISQRTPGFRGWQEEHWLYHCGDGAAFLGRVGHAELEAYPDAREMLLHENDPFGWTREQSANYVSRLQRDGEATAYLFRCLTCGTHLAYSDMS